MVLWYYGVIDFTADSELFMSISRIDLEHVIDVLVLGYNSACGSMDRNE